MKEKELKEKLPYRIEVVYCNTNGTKDKQIISSGDKKKELHKDDVQYIIRKIEDKVKYLKKTAF